MSELEKLLGTFRPLEAPDPVWKRLRGRGRRPYWKEGLMAAAGLLAWLLFALPWKPAAPTPVEPGRQDADAWLDREPSRTDVPENERIVIEALLEDLGAPTSSRRDAAEKLLEARLDTAVPFLREAARSDKGELRAPAEALVRQWEDRRLRIPLPKLLDRARKDAKSHAEWKETAERAVRGDAAAINDVHKIGWPAAPAVADAAAGADAGRQIRARALLQDLLLPLLHEGGRTVTLAVHRKNDQTYGNSAYSFRYATQDAEAVKNIIDVVYNPCGLLHLTPYGGTESFIADMGKTTLDQVTELPKQGWRRANCVLAAEKHVYVLEVRVDGKSYTYKFEVKRATALSIDLEWAGIGEPRKAPAISPLQGKNGMFGICPGPHSEY